jgi:signal transduction histidine kinase
MGVGSLYTGRSNWDPVTNEHAATDPTDRSLATAVSGTGLLLLFWSILEPVGLFATGASVVFLPRYVVGYVTIFPSCFGMVSAGRWLRRCDLPVEHHRRIGVYWLVGGGGFLAFNLGLMTFFPTGSIWIVTNWIRWALSLGLAVGLVIGITESRAIYHTISAERQSMRAEHVEKQRDLVDHMNGILRHEVLNATQVILGNASSLRENDGPIRPSDERLERIYRQGEEVTGVIQEVRSLLGAMDADRVLAPMSLADVVRSEARKVSDRHPNADVDVRIPGDVTVRGDELLGRIFGNPLSNAVEHNDADAVHVVVEADRSNGSVAVRVRDDGDGIPDRKLDALFDRPMQGDHGLGLYLVREMAEGYEGSVALLETGASGTTFEVRLPAADADAGERREWADKTH